MRVNKPTLGDWYGAVSSRLYNNQLATFPIPKVLSSATPLRPELSPNADVQRIPDTPSQMS